MSKSMIIKKEVTFNATPKSVWNLISNPKMTTQYMFGCEVLSDWKIGNQIIWKGVTEDGKEIIYVKGVITDVIQGEKLSFTMFDPNIGIKDIPENYVNLTYKLTPLEKGTKLTIIQGDFSGAENAEKRFKESQGGWDMVIPLMKKLIETSNDQYKSNVKN
ncbi:SRPBCC domain-containing protein [Zunongwangia sp. F260]|uniref:SRPBCC domain-containing protein n=1 Tax=Autumnicola lenta TaxID=3075593 RepID=A0ABU3CGV3_9FLAO|nr:SRPBCC domain-containing protein [Zunongwangia sp. F260]MDT0645478.1 SRPBCC domain-containing protein [Zunongwangia sp. F260]